MSIDLCPVCKNPDFTELYRFEPARWIPGKVVRCTACQTVYKVPSPSAKPLGEYYDSSYADSDYWQQEQEAVHVFERIAAVLGEFLGTTSLSLLDIGCGPGVFLSVAQGAGFSVTGLELNPKLAERARARTKGDVIVGDIMTVNDARPRFDVITMLDLIEHVPDPVYALKQCHALLKPGGHVVVYTPNHGGLIVRVANLLFRLSLGKILGPITEIFDCTHMVFFDVESLRLALNKAGFQLLKTVLSKYDPTRSNQARGISALALKGIEAVSPLFGGQFRILTIAKKILT